MLAFKSVYTAYGAVPVLRDVSLTAAKGGITCLLGSNGAGKTTTINTILGLVKPTRGEIVFNGERIDKLSTVAIVSKGIAVVPEGRRVFPKMTVAENLLIGACRIADKQKITANLNRMYAMFPRLAERRSQLAGTMSGGEQQMLAIGRALMSSPQLLLLDEPSLGLSPLMVKEIFDTIVTINREGTTILLIEQNAFKALAIATSAYVLQKGQILMHCADNDPDTKQQIIDSYIKHNATVE